MEMGMELELAYLEDRQRLMADRPSATRAIAEDDDIEAAQASRSIYLKGTVNQC